MTATKEMLNVSQVGHNLDILASGTCPGNHRIEATAQLHGHIAAQAERIKELRAALRHLAEAVESRRGDWLNTDEARDALAKTKA